MSQPLPVFLGARTLRRDAAASSGGGGGTGVAPSSPPAAGYPAGTTLTTYSGPQTVNTDNTIIDSKTITGTLVTNGNNITVRNCLFSGTATDQYGILVNNGNATMDHCTFSGHQNAWAGGPYYATYCEITGMTQDGCKLSSGSTVDHCYFHDFATSTGAHADGAQMQDGVTNLTIQYNWFHPTSTTADLVNSALFLCPTFGPSTAGPVNVNYNVFGGGGYTVYCVDGANGTYVVSNITFRGNRWLRDHVNGPTSVNVPVTWIDNAYQDNGEVIPG